MKYDYIFLLAVAALILPGMVYLGIGELTLGFSLIGLGLLCAFAGIMWDTLHKT